MIEMAKIVRFRSINIVGTAAWYVLLGLLAFPVMAEQRSLEIDFESEIMATKGDGELTFLEAHAFLDSVPESQQAAFLEDPDRFTRFLSNTLVKLAMAQAAVEDGLLDAPDIAARVHRAATEELALIHQERYVQERLLDDYTQQARENFITNQSRFKKPAVATFDQILLTADGENGESIKERVEEIRTQYANGRPFEALVKKFSEDPSATDNQGRLNEIPLRRLEKQFREQLVELELGDLGVIESSYGTHVVLLHRYIPERKAEFPDVAEQLVRQARQNHEQQILRAYSQKLAQSELKLSDKAIEKFLRHYGVEWD